MKLASDSPADKALARPTHSLWLTSRFRFWAWTTNRDSIHRGLRLPSFARGLSWGLLLWLILATPQLLLSQNEISLDNSWEADPDLGIKWGPPIPQLAPYQVNVDLVDSAVLQDRVSEAQDTVFQHARRGIANRSEALAAFLKRLEKDQESNDLAQQAILAAALVLIDNQDEVEQLWKRVQDDAVLGPLTEPALIKFRSPQALELWRKRAATATRNSNALVRAIEGIGAAGDATDRGLLESILRNERFDLGCKLTTARAMASVLPSGLETLAQEVRTSLLPQSELLAASLLKNHTSEAAIRMLTEIANGESPVAQSSAYRSLASNDPESAVRLANTMIVHQDSSIRREAVEVLQREGGIKSLRLMGSALADKNIEIRRQVRVYLAEQADRPERRAVVNELLDGFLEGNSDEGNEQAVLLAAKLNDNSRVQALFRLVSHPNDQVSIRAAWALSRLEIPPALLETIQLRCVEITNKYLAKAKQSDTEIYRVAFLIEALGQHRYRPAESMLMHYVPKAAPIFPVARASAVYALGRIYEEDKNAELSRILMARAADTNPLDAEDDRVRFTAAIAVGRIGSKTEIARLKRLIDPATEPIGIARGWAIDRLSQQDSEPETP